MKLALQIASRFLKYSKGQTIMIAIGIAVGVSVQVFIGLLIQGLQDGLIDKTIGSSSQITIRASEKNTGMDDYENIIEQVQKASPDVKYVSEAVDGAAFIQKDDKNEPVVMRGLDFKQSEGIYKFEKRLVEGRLPEADNEVLLGVGLAENLKIKVNDTITMLIPQGNSQEVTVVGFVNFNVAAINDGWLLSNIQTAQNFLGYVGQATSIEMQVKKVFEADVLAVTVEERLRSSNVANADTLKVTNWIGQNAELLSGLSGQSTSSLMIQVFVLVAVVLGISSVLAITVIQKSKQLGILKAMGITDRVASLIFLFEGLMLGLLGAVLGIALGLGLSYSFTLFALNPDGTPVVPLTIKYDFIAFSGLIAVFSAVLAAFIPARRSSKLNPMEVIKNG